MMKRYFLWLLCLCVFSAYAEITIPARDPFVPSTTARALMPATVPQVLLPVKSCWIPLYFAKAKNVASFLTKKSFHMLSAQGQINYDARSNQIFLEDDAKHVAHIRQLIAHLDAPTAQFLIKAKIINLNRNYQQSLGFLFHTDNATPAPLTALTMNEPDTVTNDGQFTFTIAKLADNHLLNLQISALEQEGHASLISNPELTTLANAPAIIESGAEVPYHRSRSRSCR